MSSRSPAAGFVLTGGQSRRMGADKALLELGGQPLVQRTVERLRPLVAEVALVGAPDRLTALAATRFDWNLVVACDLPYLETRFLEFLLAQASESDAAAVVPHTQGQWQPLCAAYHRQALPAFERALAGTNPKIVSAFSEIRVRAVTGEELRRFAFDEQVLKNMNAPQDYQEARRQIESWAAAERLTLGRKE
jgi:molybdopterin-guanine dinucleotide biosynthesis protein A